VGCDAVTYESFGEPCYLHLQDEVNGAEKCCHRFRNNLPFHKTKDYNINISTC